MAQLLINADDAGFAASTDTAILACAAAGVLRCASVAANGATAATFVARARDLGIDLGLHLNLTEGRPLAGPHRTLTGADGRFIGDKRELWRRAGAGALDPAEIAAETRAQWQRLLDLSASPSHADGHNHVHLFPAAAQVLVQLEPRPWCRVPLDRGQPPGDFVAPFATWARALAGAAPHVEGFTGDAFSGQPCVDVLLASLPPEAVTIELMVHPGARPGSPFVASPDRDREAAVLADPALRAALERRGFAAARFVDLPCASS
jgi:predicted glycoside hydrolase/deacetylase ChbG (UPF0249 family)